MSRSRLHLGAAEAVAHCDENTIGVVAILGSTLDGSYEPVADALPQELVFNVNYLGGSMPTFALNFSRPGAEIIAQYYTFFRLGFAGYKAVQQASRNVATSLAQQISTSHVSGVPWPSRSGPTV